MIQADAKARLPLAAGADPAQEAAHYKRYLKRETHRLKMRHRAGGGGRAVCQARSLVMDLLFSHIIEALSAAIPRGGSPKGSRFALVAIGGYGRGELNPHSDIDIMFLHEGGHSSRSNSARPPVIELLTGGLLWDIGLRVGHSVRTIADCVRVANTDVQSKTSLIEARLICGDKRLFEKMQETVLAKCVKGHENEYIEARIQDQSERRTKFGNSASMQEPNIKNGCGGLRDYQNLLWMAFFKYRSRTLADLQARDLISAQQAKELDTAYDFLLRVRNELHYHLNRAVDALSRSILPAIAHNLGYTERSPSRRIECFMRDYYLHSRNIYFITRTLEQRLALLPQPKRLPTLRQFLRQRRQLASYVLDGFKFVDGQIHAASDRIFKDKPQRLIRAFLYAQQRGLTLHPDLAQLIHNRLEMVDPQFRRDPGVREAFLQILNQRGNVAPTMRAMHEVGFLGRYLPAFGKLTCLVQHEFYHQYTTDEHTLVCIEKLDQVWSSQQPLLAPYAELFQKIERPFVLYLALLLHDAGKGSKRENHAETGAKIAVSVAGRLGLDAADTATLRLLVRLHLSMLQTSQRRDLDDPGEIRAFAAQVGNVETLNGLTLLSLADSMGTSEQLWNGFKDTLLWALHHKTRNLLTGGAEFIRAEAKQRESLAAEVRALLPDTVVETEIHAHFSKLPARYFQLRTPREIATDLVLAHLFLRRQLSEKEEPLEPFTAWHHEENRGYSQVKVCTWDRHGLFSKISGALTDAGLNILSAEIFTREDSIVLDTFLVTDAMSGVLANREEREHFERTLKEALIGELDLAALIRRRKPARLPSAYHEGERMPTVIRFDNQTSDARTIIDIETEDRMGLLFTISEVFAELAIDIAIAKICTEKGAATDTFYVSETSGKKILQAARQELIRARLLGAIRKLDEGGASETSVSAPPGGGRFATRTH